MEAEKTLTNEEIIRELLDLLKKNAMKEPANDVFEICSYVDGLEKKIATMTEELTSMQNQIREMQEDTLVNNAKKALAEAQERLNARCEQIKSQVSEVKIQVKSTAKSIVDETKAKGRAALYRVTEFAGIKKRLLNVRTAVKDAIVSTDRDVARTALLAKGLREAGQTVNNAFRTFADKPEVDYSKKEQKHPITKAVLAPMKAVRKLFVSMELHLDASIDKLDNLAMNVQLDKEKREEHTKDKEQKAADIERAEGEVFYSPMVAEPQEYKYNADAFEARKISEGKQEAAGKELPKVREDIEYNKENVLVIIEGLSMYLHENDIREIFSIIEKAFNKSTVMIETMSPFFVKHMKEKSIEGSNAKFSWGVKNGKDLQQIVPAFNWKRDVSLVEGMKVIMPVYNVLGIIPAVCGMSNKIVVMER